eukprot:g8867.t1
MADAREQQREARRQKVLARSQGGHRAPVVDLATQRREIAPQGATAVLDDDAAAAADQASVDGLLDPATPSAEDSGKSASRLAAERRRQRILSKSTERMAKVQGDRVIRGGDAEEEGTAGEGGGGESLDDMLDAAEAEFFGQQDQGGEGAAGIAEAKPAAPPQAYFKSAKGGGGGLSRGGGVEGSDVAGAAQSKLGRRVAGGGGFKPVLPEASPSASAGGSTVKKSNSSTTSRRRPTGNKALEEKHFDLAAIESLSQAAGTGNNSWTAAGSAADPARKRLLGGFRFWTGLEGVAKTALLLLAGAGVGGLLLPEARAAVAQAKFEAEHTRGFVNSRSRLELFLAGGDRGGGSKGPTALDVDFDTSGIHEFGDVVNAAEVPPPDSDSEAAKVLDVEEEAEAEGGGAAAAVKNGAGQEEYGWAKVLEEMAEHADRTDDDLVSQVTDRFLSCVDYVVGWAHYLSSVSMPWGSPAEISCVSAIYLALLVRLVVAMAFSAIRVLLGLPAFPPTASASKPGMVMGMVLASVPTLGKLLALFNMVKSIFSDTNLVVAGTVLTLAFSLAAEEGAAPRRLAGTIWGALGLAGPEDGSLKEL